MLTSSMDVRTLLATLFVVNLINWSDCKSWDLSSANGRSSFLLTEEDVGILTFNFTLEKPDAVEILAASSDNEIFSVVDSQSYSIIGNSSTNFTVKLRAIFLGRAYLEFYVNASLPETSPAGSVGPSDGGNSLSTVYKLATPYEVVVKRKDDVINTIFTVIVIVLICIANIAMGCKTDIQVVKETLKKPIAPVTGLVSQFVMMPVISFLVGYALKLDIALAFGFFALGCSPGGAASNIYTFLLDGDVSLSVTMTLISTIFSLGMIPLWLYTLGVNVIYRVRTLSIPFFNIFTSLIGLVIPVGIGIVIQKKRPRWAKIILKLVRPLTVVFVILVFTVGVYANLYVFKLLDPLTLLAGALVPYCGFFFGALVAFATRQDKAKILTIAIETGIQNTGISIFVLQMSLPPPDSDIGMVAPIVCSIFTPIPMVIAITAYEIKKRCFKKPPKEEKESSAAEDNTQQMDQNNSTGTVLSYYPVTTTCESDSENGNTKNGKKPTS